MRIANGRKEKRERIKAIFGEERNPRPDRCERGAIRRRRRGGGEEVEREDSISITIGGGIESVVKSNARDTWVTVSRRDSPFALSAPGSVRNHGYHGNSSS